jgi:hypothetical protein
MKSAVKSACRLLLASASAGCYGAPDNTSDDREVASVLSEATWGSSLPDTMTLLAPNNTDRVEQSVTTEHGFEFRVARLETGARGAVSNRSNAPISGTLNVRVWCSDQSSPQSPTTAFTVEPLQERTVETQCASGTRSMSTRAVFADLQSNAGPAGVVGTPNAESAFIVDALADGVPVGITAGESLSLQAEMRGSEAWGAVVNRSNETRNANLSVTADCQTLLGEVVAPVRSTVESTPIGPGESITTTAACGFGLVMVRATALGP